MSTYAASAVKMGNEFEFQPVRVDHKGVQPDIPINQSLIQSKINNTMQFYFIGSSHMRYNFDALLTLLYDFLGDVLTGHPERKYEEMKVDNFEFRAAVAAVEVTRILEAQCSLLRKAPQNKTIIIQTGTHDLARASPHVTISAKYQGPALVGTLERIFNGSTECPGLSKIVWMTIVPYPLCTDDTVDGPADCKGTAGFRNNPSIAAVNQFYLNNLMRVSANSHIKLSVVDAYAIIKPRLLLSEDAEAVCKNHFLCRLDSLSILTTKGGMATLLEMVKAAMW